MRSLDQIYFDSYDEIIIKFPMPELGKRFIEELYLNGSVDISDIFHTGADLDIRRDGNEIEYRFLDGGLVAD